MNKIRQDFINNKSELLEGCFKVKALSVAIGCVGLLSIGVGAASSWRIVSGVLIPSGIVLEVVAHDVMRIAENIGHIASSVTAKADLRSSKAFVDSVVKGTIVPSLFKNEIVAMIESAN